MSSVQHLREFIGERRSSEKLPGCKETIVQSEEDTDRQHRLLHISWKPPTTFNTTDQQQQVHKEEEEPEPPQIKEEQEELCISQEGEQLVLKQRTGTFIETCEESDLREPEPNSHQLLAHVSPVAESPNLKESNQVCRSSGSNTASERHFCPGAPEDRPVNTMLILPAAALCCLCSALVAMAAELVQDMTLTRRTQRISEVLVVPPQGNI
ncbi:uncharacterized protein LOC119414332 [Nematolebias whitei]|uniref:uncharacterized protein LOC119414332 n=1 Tax=Nematolebias whitei TaxID=451745 RepID=UPI00189B257D|nr:uncharacterized protein LOC119414332 [Nematolebias whitei]